MTTRKIISVLLLSALLSCAAGSALCETAEPDYYRIGLEVTGLMGEIVDSDAYLSFLTRPEMYDEIRERVNTHDYGSPAAVYSVSLSDYDAVLEEMFCRDPDSREKWDSLSPALQEQLRARLSLPALLAVANARAGTAYISLFSVSNAFVRNETLTGEKSLYYLYFFERGAPILVSFGYHTASGQFLSVPGEYRDSPEDIRADLALPGLELAPVTAADPAADPAENLASFGVSLEEALGKMGLSIKEHLPAAFFSGMVSKYETADITGDGCTDLCTCLTWGSGMVRTDLAVYDPLNEDLYILDGYNYDYLIDRVEGGRLVVVKEGPHGYGDPVTKTYGTVKLENRELIFVPDAEGR